MSFRVDNAIIMAAGASSRFAPLSQERPKALITVKGEVLIERQIRQLYEAGIPEIIVVTGYMAEAFDYLASWDRVRLVHNPLYRERNNHASLYLVRDDLRHSYICSADNYFAKNPFRSEETEAYYAAVYASGPTEEWCLSVDEDDVIKSVVIGGQDAWVMLGHALWDQAFSERFVQILEEVYDEEATRHLLWESIYMQHLDRLKLKLRRYARSEIFEFDSLEELRRFDVSYVSDTRSRILKAIAREMQTEEAQLTEIQTVTPPQSVEPLGFKFQHHNTQYLYIFEEERWRKLS